MYNHTVIIHSVYGGRGFDPPYQLSGSVSEVGDVLLIKNCVYQRKETDSNGIIVINTDNISPPVFVAHTVCMQNLDGVETLAL